MLGHLSRTKMLVLPEQFGVGRLTPGRYGGTSVYGLSFVCHPGPGSFLAVQQCHPDLSQNGANVNLSL